jgi:cytochrome o ubiquinol oxidase operon protein cyoD
MNAHGNAAQAHAHDDLHGNEGFTLRPYVIGLVLSALLTAVPFWIAMTGSIATGTAAKVAIFVFAVTQVIVQTVTFLHVNARAEGGWTLLAYVFTAVLLVITIAGSVWIMYHLNQNMMPGVMLDAPASSQVP